MGYKLHSLEENLKSRAEKLAATQGWTVAKMQQECGLSNAYFNNVKTVTPKIGMRIRTRIPNANIDYLNTGKGSVLVDSEQVIEVKTLQVPLLSISETGSMLDAFERQCNNSECEKIISPIKDATLAIAITGDSMSPEYPSGCKVLVKKIEEAMFIEWGRTYVLDTINGVVIKNIFPCVANNDKITCRSVNPNYPDFDINRADIKAWYRVLLVMIQK